MIVLCRQIVGTCLALVVVIAATAAQFQCQFSIGSGGAWHWSDFSAYGWPLAALEVTVDTECSTFGSQPVATSERHWRWRGTVFNSVIAVILATSTFSIPHSLRGRRLRLYQFTLADIGIGTLALALLLSYYMHERDILRWCGSVCDDTFAGVFSLGFSRLPWYLFTPLAFGAVGVIAQTSRFAGARIMKILTWLTRRVTALWPTSATRSVASGNRPAADE